MTLMPIGKNMENVIKQPPMNKSEQHTSITMVTATHLLAMPIVASVVTQQYLAFILVLSVEQMDIYPGSVHRCDI